MLKTPKPHVVQQIKEIIEQMSDDRDRFTITDLAEAIYEGVFAQFEKELLVTFVVSKKAYEEKIV